MIIGIDQDVRIVYMHPQTKQWTDVRCCTEHGRLCEQGGDECCRNCTEAFHFRPGHGGTPCGNPDLSSGS